MDYLLGLDISTTGVKALVVDFNGNVVSSATTPLALSIPRPLWSEQNPEDWWQGSVKSIQAALRIANIPASSIKAVGLTGQMHGLVILDASGNLLRPAILWNDQRTGEQCDEIRARVGAQRLIQITGNTALTGFTAPKILWVQQHEPDIYAKVKHILLPKDYVRYRLTGEYAMDKADGSGTILFDLKNRDWSEEVVEKLEIDSHWLPATFEGPQVTGRIQRVGSEATGLSIGTPVMAGGGDQSAQAVGVGAVEAGIIALTLGTSGVVFAAIDQPYIEPEGRLHAFCHALPDTWHFMGVMLSAAGSLQWYRDNLAPGIEYNDLINEAESVPPGSEGLFFLPYLSGERTPHPDPLARAAWIGLTLRHTRSHLTRAVLEGVAYGLKDSFMLIQNAGLGEIRQVRASGGGTRSQVWLQILADILGVELVTVNTSEGAAFGAALLAGVGAGVWQDVKTACHQNVQVTGSKAPDAHRMKLYGEFHRLYQELYPSLKTVFNQIAELPS